MKQTILFFTLIAVALMGACDKGNTEEGKPETITVPVDFPFEDGDFDARGKTFYINYDEYLGIDEDDEESIASGEALFSFFAINENEYYLVSTDGYALYYDASFKERVLVKVETTTEWVVS